MAEEILVAGGAGFLGRHVVRALAAGGAEVHVIDNFVTSDRAHFVDGAVRVIEACVTDPAGWPDDLRPDLIFNLACPASPRAYCRMPVLTLETSVLGARSLAHLALGTGARLVHASTSEVYGDPQRHPQAEDYAGNVALSGPRACYDEGKRAAEVLLGDMAATRGLDLRIARIFNTYGPGMTAGDGRAVPNFVEQALAGQPLTIEGDGLQTRSFCYVDDMVEGLLRLARSEDVGPAPVNLGNPDEVTILELAEQVLMITGSASGLQFDPATRNDPARRCPDISRARSVLGFAPEIGLATGLERTIAAVATGRIKIAH